MRPGPLLSRVREWARKQIDYDSAMLPPQFREWMNEKTGLDLPGTDSPEGCAAKWLDAIDEDQPVVIVERQFVDPKPASKKLVKPDTQERPTIPRPWMLW